MNGAKSETNSRHKPTYIDKRGIFMPKPRTPSGEKNLISKHLIQLRQKRGLSQRDLAHQLQLAGYDIDKNVITSCIPAGITSVFPCLSVPCNRLH